jgi:hypothetical protein
MKSENKKKGNNQLTELAMPCIVMGYFGGYVFKP